MSATTKTCIEVECDDCADGWSDDDYGTPHFDAGADITAKLLDWDWSVVDGKHYCRACTQKRTCAAEGHLPRVMAATYVNEKHYPEIVFCDRCNDRLQGSDTETQQ